MKTIKELEEKIEELKRNLVIKNKFEKNKPVAQFNFWIRVTEGELEQTKAIYELIEKSKVISENSYGENDGTDEIKLVKYLIDREELLKKIKGLVSELRSKK